MIYKYHQEPRRRRLDDRVHPDGDRAARRSQTPKIVWPTFAYDSERTHVGPDVSAAPAVPQALDGGRRDAARVPAGDRVRPALPRGRRRAACSRSRRRRARVRWTLRRAPLPGRVARRRRHAARHDLRGVPQPAPVPAKRRRRRRGDRAVGRHGQGALDAATSARARRRRSSSATASTSATGSARSTRSTSGTAGSSGQRAHGRGGEGRRRGERQPRLRRLVRRAPLRVRRAQRAPDLARERRSAAPRHADGSTRRLPRRTGASTSARPTARSTPSARRAASASGRTARAASSTARPPIWHQLVLVGSYGHTFYAFDAATGDTRWTLQGERPDLGLGDGDRRRRLLRDADEEGPDVRARRAHGPPALELRRRALHAGRRRQGAPVSRRLREALRLRAAR